MEDFNSMGATSAHKLLRVLDQARQVVAIELMSAAQIPVKAAANDRVNVGIAVAADDALYRAKAKGGDHVEPSQRPLVHR